MAILRGVQRWAGGALAILGLLPGLLQAGGPLLDRPLRALAPAPPSASATTPAPLGWAYEDVAFPGPRGLTLRGWWVPGSGGSTVVMVHSWRESRTASLGRAGYLHQAGHGLLLFDLPGHGASGGDVARLDYLDPGAVGAAVAYAHGRAGGPVALLGYSLGAALAVEDAAHDPGVAAVIEDSGFASLTGVFGVHFERLAHLPAVPFALPVELLGGAAFGLNPWAVRPVEDAAALRKPLLAIMGAADPVVPPSQGLSLYRAAAGPKQLLVVPGAGHCGAYYTDPARYRATVLAFLADSRPASASAGRTSSVALAS